ncbi:hypothetical protein [Falsiroseomonas sp. CW058]|uniref:hypothetical protein n=1 Tax=Falsiroseomonas sp. CW058 TaxID=3388664 RepID=UPI003D32215D
MMRSGAVACLLLALGVAAPALAQPRPAPACAAPAGPLRAGICADAELRAADARMRGLERALAATTARPATMAERARAWQRQLEAGEPGQPPRAFDRDALLDDYGDRIRALEEALRQDRALRRLEQPRCPDGQRNCPPSPVFPRPAAMERTCLGNALRDCRVTGAGLAVSADGTTRVLWQAQRGFTEQDGLRAGIVLLAEARGGWRLLGWSFEGHHFDAPRLVEHEGGWLLHLPGRGGGSGSVNTDLLYRLDRTGWAEVETEGWLAALPGRLPPGLGVWQAVEYDFEDLAARAALWRDGDANCCPTGGRARFDLRIEGRSVVLAAVALDGVARAAQPQVEACPAERATYHLNAAADYTADLLHAGPGAGAASDLVFRVTSAATRRQYWFVFAAAQGYGGLSLLPVAAPGPTVAEDGLQRLDAGDEPAEPLRVYPMAEDLGVSADAPGSGRPAPRHIFTPTLGLALHYGSVPGTPPATEPREAMPPAVWTLGACRAR